MILSWETARRSCQGPVPLPWVLINSLPDFRLAPIAWDPIGGGTWAPALSWLRSSTTQERWISRLVVRQFRSQLNISFSISAILRSLVASSELWVEPAWFQGMRQTTQGPMSHEWLLYYRKGIIWGRKQALFHKTSGESLKVPRLRLQSSCTSHNSMNWVLNCSPSSPRVSPKCVHMCASSVFHIFRYPPLNILIHHIPMYPPLERIGYLLSSDSFFDSENQCLGGNNSPSRHPFPTTLISPPWL